MFDKYEKIRGSGLKVLDIIDISIILGLKLESARVIATRMVKRGVLERLKRDLYLLSGADISDFEIANKLIVPSYVSFESALNYWGVTTQIPALITSAAKRSKQIIINEKEFQFSSLPEKLFIFGFVKEGSFFIASPEKALLDVIYYATLGKRSADFDLFDIDKINRKKFNTLLRNFTKRTKKLAKEIVG